MKTSLLLASALAIALTGCNKSTRSSGSTASTDYSATNTTAANATVTDNNTVAGNTTTTARDSMNRVGDDLHNAANSASNAIGSAASNVATTARIAEWHLSANDLQADLDNNREIVRTKDDTAGAPTASADTKVIESMVKGRLEADSDIARLKLDADADRHGEVKLTGKAESAEQVGRAIALALDTEGVTKVTSKIKIDKTAKTNR
jgi:osmotically-inducible protein OsmY